MRNTPRLTDTDKTWGNMRSELDPAFLHLATLMRGDRTADSVTSLARDAAKWVASARSIPLPQSVDGRPDQSENLSPQIRAANRSLVERLDKRGLSTYVPDLIEAMTGSWMDSHVASPSLDQVARTLLIPRPGVVPTDVAIFDCAAGIGSSLVSVARAVKAAGSTVEIFAQEINNDVAAIAEINFFLAGIPAHVEVGDSLTGTPASGQRMDFAVSQAPMGMSWSTSRSRIQSLASNKIAYNFGLPRTSDSSWLFAQRAIEKLKTADEGGGRAVVFVNGSALRLNDSAHIRRALLEGDLLDVAVALPGGLLPFTSIPIYALVFDTAKPDARRGAVRFIDLRSQFENNKARSSSQWRLTEQGAKLLETALRTSKDSALARTVGVEKLFTTRHRVSQPSSTESTVEWTIEVPGSDDPLEFTRKRYPLAPHLALDASGTPQVGCRIDIEAHFEVDNAVRWARERNWDSVRLSSLLGAPPVLVGNAKTYLPRDFSVSPLVATEALTQGESESTSDNQLATLIIQIDPAVILPGYLTWWLNSPVGRDSLDRARRATERAESARALHRRQLTQLLDQVVVPIAPLNEQVKIAAEEAKLLRLESLVHRSRSQYWEDPKQEIGLLSKIDELLSDPPEAWAQDLPYPLAAALWTLHTKDTSEAKHGQIFLFWEAYAAFSATTVLSALSVDESLADEHRPELDRLLREGVGSLDQASFGTWYVTFQYLSAIFRRMLDSADEGERDRASRLFGGVSVSALSRILSPTVVDLIRDANTKRNLWAGHKGASNAREVDEQLEYMETQVEKLRGTVGTAWRQLRLVRARAATRKDGVITQVVESLLGPSTPFRADSLTVQEMMDTDKLYLISPPSEQAVQLYPFVTMQSAPASEKSTSYFYSRRADAQRFRFVSYETADQSEIVVTDPHIDRAIGSSSDSYRAS